MSDSSGWHDTATGSVVNESGADTEDVMWALQRQHPEMAALVRWSHGTQSRRQGSIFQRDRFVTPDSIVDQFLVARDAAESDDVVSGVLDSTESLAFSKMSFEADDEDEDDIWNQIAGDLDLDSRLREMWRELFIVSQFYVAIWWQRKSYKVRGKSDTGTARKKVFKNLLVPAGLTLLDPSKVVPAGTLLFNRESLLYAAEDLEAENFDDILGGKVKDPMVKALITERHEVKDRQERKAIGDLGFDVTNLFTLNPKNVWRHTATRPQFQRFATVRMKSCFELLDLKNQLREMDRAHLIGGSNFIVLVKKGTDQMPAKAAEVTALARQVRQVARVPVIVGDHRLAVEIITPNNDRTLDAARYDAIDARITARLYQMFMTGSSRSQKDDSIKLARVVARGMESRRHMMRRSIEAFIMKPTVESNEELTVTPSLRFHPKRIALDFDPAVATFLQDLRDRGDLSRDSILQELDYDQQDEAKKREREIDKYDKIFQTATPWGGGASVDPKTAGRTGGGNRNGGGAAPGTGQGQEPATPAKPKRKPTAT